MPRVSIQFKLLVLLMAVCLAVLASYAWMMLSDFNDDKLAHTYDSTLNHAREVAGLVRSEVEFGVDKTRTMMQLYSVKKSAFRPEAVAIFADETGMRRLEVFNSVTELPVAALYRKGEEVKSTDAELLIKREAIEEALKSGLGVRARDSSSSVWFLAVASGPSLFIVGTFDRGNLGDVFFRPQTLNTYLVDAAGTPLFKPREPRFELAETQFAEVTKSVRARGKGQAFGVLEIDSGESRALLISYADVGLGGLRVISLIPTSSALEGAQMFIKKSGVFAIFLVSLALLVSVVASNGLTTHLRRLHEAVLEMAKGNFNVQVDEDARDEVGELTKGVNHMAREIVRLLKDTEDKVRMEGELKTAWLVQSTLFPPSKLDLERISLRGFYQPASECSGDWWNYVRIGTKVYFTVADATGHGVPAALITSAARSASSILSGFPDLDVSARLDSLNRAIGETAQGQMQMTCFLACLDEATGELTFASASHDPPWLFRPKADGEALKRADIEYLMPPPGPRLGDPAVGVYKQEKLQLNSGDTLFFYTDGLTELLDPEGKQLGERKLGQTILKSFNGGESLDESIERIQSLVVEHRNGAVLADDITYLLIRYS